MSALTWVSLTTVFDRIEAEMIKSALEAVDISVELSQESVGSTIPVSFGKFAKVEIFVPQETLEEAQAWLKEYEDNAPEPEDDSSDDDLDYIEIAKP